MWEKREMYHYSLRGLTNRSCQEGIHRRERYGRFVVWQSLPALAEARRLWNWIELGGSNEGGYYGGFKPSLIFYLFFFFTSVIYFCRVCDFKNLEHKKKSKKNRTLYAFKYTLHTP